MTGQWEQGLRNLAEGGEPWDVPARNELIVRLQQLAFVLDKVVSEPGLTGESGSAATKTFAAASKDIAAQIAYLQDDLQTALKDANAQRARARERLESLGSGRLTAGQEGAVRGAVAGTTLMLGPLSVVAGEGAVQLLNDFLGDQREKEAEQHYKEVSEAIAAVKIAVPPPLTGSDAVFAPDPVEPVGGTPIPVGGGPGGPGGGRGGGGPSLPGFETGAVIGEPGPNGLPPVIGSPPVIGGPPVFDPPHYPAPHPPGPPIDLGKIPPDYVPTPDGPIGGVGSLPGGGSSGGATLPGGGGGASGMGPGLGVGMAVGGGGAAALGRLGSSGGMPGGQGGGLSGGLLGRGGSAGAPAGGLGVRSGSGLAGGGVGGMGGAGAQAGARAGTPGTAGAAGQTGGRGGMGAGVGGGGMGGARGDRKESAGRGLGGPIAEHLDDDEEFGPRSENAGAGGRE
ncbi:MULTISPECIES: hypothetical protein [unclassified Microbacterium]|uniref:hypothetical protein n=1 Tax=unclassified Microbacterium TaxID=2609290 RepID=UPI0025514CF6|nr:MULTISPECIES: hypothetical protein [unclassified Microbacterium]MDL5352868.1 hypothetical protein [Microbacterium sp. zg-YB36]WIM16222.1 hypothetical protein QNO11_00900 [Microbacterium sp. zg-B96]